MENENQSPTTTQTVNFTAFDNMRTSGKSWLFFGLPCVVMLVFATVVSMLQSNQAQDGSTAGEVVGILFFLSFLLLVGGIILYAWRQSKYQKAAFDQFLLDNGFTADEGGGLDMVATSLLGIGHNQKVKQAFRGTYRGRPVHGVMYDYTTGSGKSQQTYSYASLYFELNQEFPLIVLDNKGKGLAGLFDQLPERIPSGKTLQLEGDFNDNYRVTVLPGTEQEVLQFLTPDFMAELLQAPKNTDVEIEGNKLFVIALVTSGFNDSFTGQILRQLFADSDIVLKHLLQVAFSWQASSSTESVETMAATALAPRSRVLIGKRHVGLGGLVGFAAYILLSAGPGLGAKGLIVVLPVALALGVVGLYMLWEHHR